MWRINREPKNLGRLIMEEEQERWRIEAEVLRAECKFLRMQRDLAFHKLEEAQGRKKIDGSRRLLVDVRRKRRGINGSNFDRNASVVHRQLESGEEKVIREDTGSSRRADVVAAKKNGDEDVNVSL